VRALLLIAVVGCASTPAPPPPKQPPAPPVPTTLDPRSCADAAIGIERGTKTLRPPEQDVIGPMRQRCLEDAWPAAAIECFAGMTEDGLATCVRHLAVSQREKLLVELNGTNQDDAVEIAEIIVRLQALKVGIINCDRFVQAVTSVMSCQGMASAVRVQLGNETADFWSLPTSKLSIEDRARMAAACGESLQALQQQTVDVGCMP
jgi:hypothetical protein